jgi:hypothetical protein
MDIQWGERLVGAYHELATDCEMVSYNHRSDEPGDQMEADVIEVKTDSDGNQTVYICEVVTHLDGDLYSGEPNSNRWDEYVHNDAYRYSLEKLWTKFMNDCEYVEQTLPTADEYRYQFWSPVVSGWQHGSDLIDGLEALAKDFEEETGQKLELIINQDYTHRIEELRGKAEGDTSAYGSPAFRFLQILENLKHE